ncbi:anaerobic benzoate catabolism transcriptional regulator [compost metagenome]|jgi:transcriptional regulator with XRE-family HTH domain|uniref:helix-turn-helix transcriptional regulator n=1 Tax=Pseudomonas putida TaxID=303 RepID=UPI000FBCD3D0|nr:helix-turn-helix domain-containing protein [Pseudomonas putida]
MDSSFIIARLGQQVRQRRLNRGFTQAKLAALAGVTRQKVIAIERGDPSVGMAAYARVVGALDCEFALEPAAMPTLDEIQGVFD